jgi:hypothetical protein
MPGRTYQVRFRIENKPAEIVAKMFLDEVTPLPDEGDIVQLHIGHTTDVPEHVLRFLVSKRVFDYFPTDGLWNAEDRPASLGHVDLFGTATTVMPEGWT